MKQSRPFLSRLRRAVSGPAPERAAGFSLIEVNVAILVIAGGMLSLFTLFPAGLRLSTAALSDTRQSLFASDFFAYFQAGVTGMSLEDWKDIQSDNKGFWHSALENGLKEGFGADLKITDKTWEPDDAICEKWDGDLTTSDFKRGKAGDAFCLRFVKGSVKGFFSEGSRSDPLPAEFVVRIASDTRVPGDPGRDPDALIWRVSLIVSDEGENGWFYDNPVYHRDFRYADLP